MEGDRKQEMERRTFLRKVGVTALATAWAAPIIQTVPASVAHATGLQTPPHPGTTTTTEDNGGGGGDTGGGDTGGGDTGGGDTGGGDTGDDDWGGGGDSDDD